MPASYANSPGAGPAVASKNMLGDAIYQWCCGERDYGHVFSQEEIFSSNLIPNRDLQSLIQASTYLVQKRLFKIHDLKGTEAIGWELVTPEIAQSYDGLTSDEQMVYASIESAGSAGIWTKAIKAKSGVHTKVLDRVYKSLETRHLIKQMKSVKNPGRKMYILYGLQPSEEATGGAWFTEGRLDTDMIEAISGFVEQYCARQSWREITESDDEEEVSFTRKRKHPDDGFDETGKGKGKAKMPKVEHEEQKADPKAKSKTKPKPPQFAPFEAGYTGYPTIRDISKQILTMGVLEAGQVLPDNALTQLLDVMVYDTRLVKTLRSARAGEMADSPETGMVNMYRCHKTGLDLQREKVSRQRQQEGRSRAIRAQEIEDIGAGGSGEVPCLDCPNFDICGDGGPVNIETCEYMEPWYRKMEEADREVDDPWPNVARPTKPSAYLRQ